MNREEAIKEINKVFEPAFANYIIIALTETVSNRTLEQEPCEDAISRAETVKFLANHSNYFEDAKFRMAFKTASSLVNNPCNLPTVRPTQIKGKWITKFHGFPPEPTTVCSECGFDRDFNINIRGFGKIKYCPNCGAKMEEK